LGVIKQQILKVKETKHTEKCGRAVRRASELYYRALIRKKFNAHPDIPSLQKFLKSGIKELHALHRQTHSAEVLYFLKYLELDFFQNEKNFALAQKKCVELLEVIRKNVSVFTHQRIDYACGNYAQCCMYLGEYSFALKLLKGLEYLIPYSLDWLESKEVEFRILFYQKKYAEAKRLLDILQKKIPDDIEPIRLAKIKFFLSCVLLLQRDFKKTEAILHANSELLKDKSGWAVSIRLVELMALAEQNKKKEIIHAAKHLKKFIAYTVKNRLVSKRDELMLDLFLALSNLESKRMRKRIVRIQKILSVKKGEYAWDVFGHEIIRYDEWLGKFTKRQRPPVFIRTANAR